MVVPLRISRFTGMNNVSGGGWVAEETMAPALLLNAVPDQMGRLAVREGSTLHMAIADCHSLFLGVNATLCVGDGQTLYLLDLDAKTKAALATVAGPKTPLSYVEIGRCVYMSNRHWCAALENGAVRKWGRIIDQMNALAWVREANGSRFFLADAAGRPTATLKPHDYVHPPEPMDFIAKAHGRIWGARGKSVVFSDAVSVEWFQDDTNRIDFEEEPTMIAESAGGLFIGFPSRTVFLMGTQPLEMQPLWKNIGALPRTLQYTDKFSELGANVPIWGTPNSGIVAGLPDGSIVSLTKDRMRYDPGESVGSLFRIHKGEPQYLMTIIQPEEVQRADPVTHDWVRDIYQAKLSATMRTELYSSADLETS